MSKSKRKRKIPGLIHEEPKVEWQVCMTLPASTVAKAKEFLAKHEVPVSRFASELIVRELQEHGVL